MHSFAEVEKTIWASLPLGKTFSMPIPIKRDDDLLDVVFLYSVNHSTLAANQPAGVIEIDVEKGTSISTSCPATFGNVDFQPAPFENPVSFREKNSEAENLYAEVREETAAGEVGPASKRYAELVWAVTQKPLRPYYRALSPALFADCK